MKTHCYYMKKFTSINKQESEDMHKSSTIQEKINKIVLSTLNISVDGSINEHIKNDIKIDGVSELTAELNDYISELVYENTKYIIDTIAYRGIGKANEYLMILESQAPHQLRKHRTRIEDLLNKSDIEKHATLQANKIQNGEKAYQRAVAAQQMIVDMPTRKKDLSKLYDIFLFRSKQLGYKL